MAQDNNRINNSSYVQQTIDYITDLITRGELTPGSKIPTEVQLSETLGLSRNTVREAIKILIFMGVLEIRRPEGTFVRSGFSESLIDPMLYGIILNQGDGYDRLMELREMMEVGVLQLAIQKASDEEIESLRGPLSDLEKACYAKKPSLETVFEADNQFHVALNKLGGNEMVDKISNTVRTLTHAMRHESVSQIVENKKTEDLYKSHELLFNILKDRDTENLNKKVRSTYYKNGLPVETLD